MWSEIDTLIKTCEQCIRRKASTDVKAPLVNILTSQPLQLVCIYFLTLDKSKRGFEKVLVITHHFTRFAVAIPTKDQSAKQQQQLCLID